MKKIFLGVFLLSSFAMADVNGSDLNKVNVLGKVDLYSKFVYHVDTFSAQGAGSEVAFGLKLDTKINDFIIVDAKLSRAALVHGIHSFDFGAGDGFDFLKLGLDFNKAGIASVSFYGPREIRLGYENKFNVNGLRIGTDTKLKIAKDVPISTKLSLDYDVLDGLNVFTSGEVIGAFKQYEVSTKIGEGAYINGHVSRLHFGGYYNLGLKHSKNNLQNTLEVKYASDEIELDDFREYKEKNKLVFSNKFAYKIDSNTLNVAGLSITPKLDAALGLTIAKEEGKSVENKEIRFHVTPGIQADYAIKENILLKSEASVGFSYKKEKDIKVDYVPSVMIGIEYKF